MLFCWAPDCKGMLSSRQTSSLVRAALWHPALPITLQVGDAETRLSPRLSLRQQRGGFYGLLSPGRRAGKLLTAFPCNLGVSLPCGFCEQAETRKAFRCPASDLCLCQKSAESALTIVLHHTIYPELCFCLSARYAADCRRFRTDFEPVTDDKREKSLLKKKGTILNHIASFLSLEHSRAGSA